MLLSTTAPSVRELTSAQPIKAQLLQPKQSTYGFNFTTLFDSLTGPLLEVCSLSVGLVTLAFKSVCGMLSSSYGRLLRGFQTEFRSCLLFLESLTQRSVGITSGGLYIESLWDCSLVTSEQSAIKGGGA